MHFFCLSQNYLVICLALPIDSVYAINQRAALGRIDLCPEDILAESIDGEVCKRRVIRYNKDVTQSSLVMQLLRMRYSDAQLSSHVTQQGNNSTREMFVSGSC